MSVIADFIYSNRKQLATLFTIVEKLITFPKTRITHIDIGLWNYQSIPTIRLMAKYCMTLCHFM